VVVNDWSENMFAFVKANINTWHSFTTLQRVDELNNGEKMKH